MRSTPPPRRRLLTGLAAMAIALAACTSDADPETIEREPTPTDPSAEIDDDEIDEDVDGENDGGAGDPGSTDDPPPVTTDGAGDEGPDSDQPGPDGFAWSRCDDDEGFDAALDCATLQVPLDHDDPDGETIGIALVRLAASGQREGAVLMNPGGPGGSGVDFAAALASYAVAEMGLADFDIIGFDPRGVDRSNGLRCLDDTEMDDMLFDRVDDVTDPSADPDDDPVLAEGEEALGAGLDDERFAEACLAAFGDTLQHYSTDATARDMDLIREAIGDDTISFIGISYGTYLGAVYTSLFPDRVRAFVLDSAFEPTGDTVEQQYLTQLVGFEEAFDAWAADCQADTGCPFGAPDVAARWDTLRERLDAEPIPNADDRVANRDVIETATVAALYDRLTWSRLSTALSQAEFGDPSGLFSLADLYLGREADGTYSTLQQSTTIIRCASGIGAAPPDDPEALAELIRESAPRWGAEADADSFTDRCADLVPQVELPPLSFDGDAPVVVIGGVNDPATPFRWSEVMADTLGPTAVLVTWNGEGHGQLFGSSCLLEVGGRVITDLELPAEGTVCEPDPDVERPEFWDDLPVPEGVSPQPLPADSLVLLGLPPRLVFGEARTTTLDADALLAAYDEALTALEFQAFGVEEPLPGTRLATYLSPTFEVLSILVLEEEAFEGELAGAASLVDEGETLFALVSFPT